MAKLVSFENKEIDLLLDYLANTPDADDDLKPIVRRLEKARKTITTASAKGKGRSLQQWACERISGITGIPYTPGDDDSLIASRPMGQSGLDVVLAAPVRVLFPFSVECKSTESFSLGATVDQVKANVLPGTDWLIVHRSKRFKDPIVVLSWDAFARKMGEWQKLWGPKS